MSEDQNRARLERELFIERNSPELKQRQRVQSRRIGRDFQSLEPLAWMDHVRRRPALWFGDRGALGKQTVVTELVSNSIDQFLAGKATFVSVSIEGDQVEVKDDGEGYPLNVYHGIHPTSYGEDLLCYLKPPENYWDSVGAESQTSRSKSSSTHETNQIKVLEFSYLTQIHVTATADHHAPHIHFSAWNGIGIAPVNVACKSFIVQAWRGRELWEQRFSNGVPLCDPFRVKKGDGRGTTWRLQFDSEIFGSDPIDIISLRQEFQHGACIFPGLNFILQKEEQQSTKGLIELCELLSSSKATDLSWSYQCVKDDIRLDVAAWGRGEESQFKGYANGRICEDGGTHVDGVMDALAAVDWKPEVAVVHVIFEKPQFANPLASRLGNENIRSTLREALKEPLQAYRGSWSDSP
ncbi:MAG: hypothetical protein P1V97_04960 [Planctomycetota bacterium]|nr:hypothetical protein [Planctomycetota bacterium]